MQNINLKRVNHNCANSEMSKLKDCAGVLFTDKFSEDEILNFRSHYYPSLEKPSQPLRTLDKKEENVSTEDVPVRDCDTTHGALEQICDGLEQTSTARYNESWPSTLLDSPQLVTSDAIQERKASTRNLEEFLSNNIEPDRRATLASLVQRFREQPPCPKSEREDTTSSNTFWWLNQYSSKNHSTATEDIKQPHTSTADFDTTNTSIIQDQASQLLRLSSETLSSIKTSTPESVKERNATKSPTVKTTRPNNRFNHAKYAHEKSNLDETAVSMSQDNFLNTTPGAVIQRKPLRKEDDILYQWRLARKIEIAAAKSSTFNALDNIHASMTAVNNINSLLLDASNGANISAQKSKNAENLGIYAEIGKSDFNDETLHVGIVNCCDAQYQKCCAPKNFKEHCCKCVKFESSGEMKCLKNFKVVQNVPREYSISQKNHMNLPGYDMNESKMSNSCSGDNSPSARPPNKNALNNNDIEEYSNGIKGKSSEFKVESNQSTKTNNRLNTNSTQDKVVLSSKNIIEKEVTWTDSMCGKEASKEIKLGVNCLPENTKKKCLKAALKSEEIEPIISEVLKNHVFGFEEKEINKRVENEVINDCRTEKDDTVSSEEEFSDDEILRELRARRKLIKRNLGSLERELEFTL